MSRAVLLSALMVVTSLGGCTMPGLEGSQEGDCEYDVDGQEEYGGVLEDGSCFPMRGPEFSTVIMEMGHFDGFAVASQFPSFEVRVIDYRSVDGIDVSNSWMISKNDTLGLSYVGHTLVIDGVMVTQYEVYHGHSDVYFSGPDGELSRGRDMHPDYEDPFAELLRLSLQDPSGTWPSLYYDLSGLASQSWVVTGDVSSHHQIGRALIGDDGGWEVYVGTIGLPPRIQDIGVYSDSLEPQYELRVHYSDGELQIFHLLQDGTYEEMMYSQGYIPNPTLDRAPVPFIPVPEAMLFEGNVTGVTGVVPEAMKHEVNLSDVEMHVFVDNSSVANLTLDDASNNVTSEAGEWWDISWQDEGHIGLLSHADRYTVTTNSSASFDIRFFDTWAQAWTDGLE